MTISSGFMTSTTPAPTTQQPAPGTYATGGPRPDAPGSLTQLFFTNATPCPSIAASGIVSYTARSVSDLS